MGVRVLQFTDEVTTEKCLLYIHCRGLGDMTAFRSKYQDVVVDAQGIPGYSAECWSTLSACRAGDNSLNWAIPLNDKRIDTVLTATPVLSDEVATVFGVQFSEVPNTFWTVLE